MYFPGILALVAAISQPGLKIDIRTEEPVPISREGIELVFVDPAAGEILRQKVPVPWQGQLDLDRSPAGLSMVIESPSWWGSSQSLADGSSAEPVRIQLFPRGEIVFSEAAVSFETPPRKEAEKVPIVVDVVSNPVQRGPEALKKARLDCRFEGERWHCPAPALTLDLRFGKEMHSPYYAFNVKLEPGKTVDLGRIRFVKGGSISGFVTVEEGEPKGVELTLQATGTVREGEHQRQELRTLTAVANDRGFFQISGVAAGGYRLAATRKGLTTSEIWPVDVGEGEETALSSPLYLTRAAEVTLNVSPPLGPLGKPWKLLLVRDLSGSEGSDETYEGLTDETGTWVWRDLRPGSYFLNVSNPDGEPTGAGEDSIWHSELLELAPGDQSLFVEIRTVSIEGSFQAGDEPLQARLIFGGYHGAPHVVLWSDEEGHFQGQLPREGKWELDAQIDGRLVSLETVDVQPRGGRPARLDIRLPDTRFHGRVTHAGEPVEGATLWGLAQDPVKTSRFDTETDTEGRFDLEGLNPGRYSVTAAAARQRLGAPQLYFDIQEGGEPPEVEIELEKFLRIEGQILANGVPAPLANFRALLRTRQGEDIRSGQSDGAGVLALTIPESSREVSLVVCVPGFAWQIVPLRPSLSASGFAPFVVEVFQTGGTLQIMSSEMQGIRLVSGSSDLPLHLVRGALRAAGYFLEEQGSFLLKNAAPGIYRACRADQCVEGVLAPGGSLALEIKDLQKGGVSPETKTD